MGCLGRWWRLQTTGAECRVLDFAICEDFGVVFAIEDTHGFMRIGGIGGEGGKVPKNVSAGYLMVVHVFDSIWYCKCRCR